MRRICARMQLRVAYTLLRKRACTNARVYTFDGCSVQNEQSVRRLKPVIIPSIKNYTEAATIGEAQRPRPARNNKWQPDRRTDGWMGGVVADELLDGCPLTTAAPSPSHRAPANKTRMVLEHR
jgi:hypothetical protein